MEFKFNDMSGREWKVDVTPPERDAILEVADLDLYEIQESEEKIPEIIGRLETDDKLLTSVMWGVCREQAEQEGINRNSFERAMYGESLDKAMLALMRSLAFFFRKLITRALLHSTIKAMELAAEKVEQGATLMGSEADKLMAETMQGIDLESLVRNSMNSAGRHSQNAVSKTGKRKVAKRGDSRRTNSSK